jgi:hypothetical protein
VVEGTPLLREHTDKTRIEGSNPSVSARHLAFMLVTSKYYFATHKPTPEINKIVLDNFGMVGPS